MQCIFFWKLAASGLSGTSCCRRGLLLLRQQQQQQQSASRFVPRKRRIIVPFRLIHMSSLKRGMRTATFTWLHGGGKVQLSGTFSEWKPIDMEKQSDGKTWSITLNEITEGRHEFKFVVDGSWVHDPEQEAVTNDVGSFNNVFTFEKNSEENSRSSSSLEGWEVVEAEPKRPTVEVERKFAVPANYKELLLKNGFKIVEGFDEETLKDTYFDTKNYNLMGKDYWLRLRNGDWELKYPVDIHPSGSTLYHETSDSEDIMSKILHLIKEEIDNSDSRVNNNLGDLVINGILNQFAILETRRQCFVQDNVNVVVDVTDWGYTVGEIEIVVQDKVQVPEATRKIEAIAKQLEFNNLDLVSIQTGLEICV